MAFGFRRKAFGDKSLEPKTECRMPLLFFHRNPLPLSISIAQHQLRIQNTRYLEPYTLYPTPYTLYLIPYTLHLVLFTPYPILEP